MVSSIDGSTITRFHRATITADRQSLYFTDGKGHFRILNFAAKRWFNIHLPLRIGVKNSSYENWNSEISFSHDGKWATDQTKEGQMRLWNVETRKITATLKDMRSTVAYPMVMAPVIWSPDSSKIATLGEDPSHHDIYYEDGPNDGANNEHSPVIKIWDAHTGKLLQWFELEFVFSGEIVFQMAWLDNDRLFAGGSYQFLVRSISQRKYLQQPLVSGQERLWGNAPYSLAPDGSRVFVRSQFIALKNNTRKTSFKPLPTAPIRSTKLAWSRDSKYLAASFNESSFGGIQVWRQNSQTNNEGFALTHLDYLSSPIRIGWTRSNWVWSSNRNNIIYRDSRRNWRSEIWNAPVIGPAYNPGSYGRSSTTNGLFALGDGKTKIELPTGYSKDIYRLHPRRNQPLLLFMNAQLSELKEVLSPDERFLCFPERIKDKSYLRVFDLKVPDRTFNLPHAEIKNTEIPEETRPIFSENGKRLAWGGNIWELPTGKLLIPRKQVSDGIALAFNHNGTELIRISPQGLRLFSVPNGQFIKRISYDTTRLEDGKGVCAWSPNDQFIALTRTNFIEIYDVKRALTPTSLYAWAFSPRRSSKQISEPQWLTISAGGHRKGTNWAKSLCVKFPRFCFQSDV